MKQSKLWHTKGRWLYGEGNTVPLWLHIVCEIIFALFILRGLYAIWKYAVYQHIFARKKCVEATLVSKVKERYR